MPKGPRGDALSDREFAERALAVFKHAVRGERQSPVEDSIDVRRVGLGLATIEIALKRYVEAIRHSPEALPATAIVDACEIIDALTREQAHPIWRYLKGLSNSGLPTLTETMRRGCVGGTALAYKKAAATISERKAASIVAELYPDHFTSEQVRSWARSDSDGECVIAFANEIYENALKLPDDVPLCDRVLLVGKRWIDDYWVTPLA